MATESHPNLRHRRHPIGSNKDDEGRKIDVMTVAVGLTKHTGGDDNNDHHVDMGESATDGYILTPLQERSIWMRLDVGPFLLAYGILVSLDVVFSDSALSNDGVGGEAPMFFSSAPSSSSSPSPPRIEWIQTFSLIAFPIILVAHLGLFLLQQWSVAWQAKVGYQQVKPLAPTRQGGAAGHQKRHYWTHCLVVAPHVDQHHSSHDAGIVQVYYHKDVGKNSHDVAVVNFQDVVFRGTFGTTAATKGSENDDDGDDKDVMLLWSTSASTPASNTTTSTINASSTFSFRRLRYPIHFPLDFYQQWKGHASIQKLRLARDVYGTNTTPIELPPFSELLKEQVVAPFFLFQVLCVLLWSLDEYWYYALFTFVALLCFESTVAYNRLKALQRLRSYTVHDQRPIWVYRPSYPPMGTNGWIQLSIAELLPGDIVSCKQITLSANRGTEGSRQLRAQLEANLVQKEQQLNRVPADILILNGDGVVDEACLTGESVPQLKVQLEADGAGAKSALDLQEHKQFMLFGGTTLLVSHPGQSPLTGIPNAPDEGAIGMVLRTGFETAQGSLLRTMAHTQKSVDGIHTRDTYFFILILLCCAVASATVVWNEGWNDADRNKFRLVLHVIIIVTSVVPPELPMELSLAVTNSVADLMKRKIFCTEVFRIPLAGQVDVCCFDKTGTLTSDQMDLKGVRLVDSSIDKTQAGENFFTNVLAPDASLPWTALRVMVSCHSLALSGGGRAAASVIGDPLEKTVLEQTGYELVKNNALRTTDKSPAFDKPDTVLILHRFGFNSRLKRMSVLARETTNNITWVLAKGAPETLKLFLRPDSIPPDYDEISRHHMALGQRVLAMAYRELTPKEASGNLKDLNRAEVESNLIFAGFLLLWCPIKADSSSVVSELWKSGHSVVMITGDALLTAAEVARQVGIIRKTGKFYPTTYQLEYLPLSTKVTNIDDLLSQFRFVPLDHQSTMDASDVFSIAPTQLRLLKEMVDARKVAFCVSGETLQQLVVAIVKMQRKGVNSDAILKDEKQSLLHPSVQAILKEIVPLISVFARHAPRQKEAVVAAFNLGRLNTCMVGDGTNDVGALRRAHVGISIISAPEVEAKQRMALQTISQMKKDRKKKNASKSGSPPTKAGVSYHALEKSMKQLQEAQDELDQVELGDASIASPFTSRMVSIKCCKDVIQQGRCTLVTMLQIYKILGVNCLVNATILSKLFLHGVKQGDRQLTILGLVVAALFFFVTRGKPLPVLSHVRPPTSVLSPQALVSIATQFVIHYTAMMVATEVALSFVDPYDPSMIPDGPFNPNTLNTCTFLVSVLATVNTFAVNYAGEPFVEPLPKNKILFHSLQVCYGVLLGSALEVFPPLNDLLQLAELPDTTKGADTEWMSVAKPAVWVSGLLAFVQEMGFPLFLCCLMIADTALVFLAERLILSAFHQTKKHAKADDCKSS